MIVQAEDPLDERGLAAAVGAEHRETFTAVDAQRRARDDRPPGVPERGVDEFDERAGPIHEQPCPAFKVSRLVRMMLR
ncbi:hypothetical protein GCM10025883_21060 [Mobilicoccus caccae]|uniref:Uncharacterized protein n=1 Tax=Mobilicoccus caccae TaxID=1859295 RepID=A0ABQ6IQS1_9MICO|nr:hypothetical protein GCM10025883_21060 [Mobilicoccus caccae]